MKFKFLAAIGLAATLYSCDDETQGIGQFIIDDELIEAKAESYEVETASHLLDSVYSRSSTAYLGKFTDEHYGTFSSDFLVQINCPENFVLPETLKSIDEVSLGLYYMNYFGDSLATLRLQVDTLTTVIKDDGKDKNLYYSNPDLTKYYDASNPFLAVKDYSAYDKTVSDSIRNLVDMSGNKTYYPNVSVKLDDKFCKMFSDKYNHTVIENGKTVHPYFKDSESFIKNVLKGFYIHTTHGEGSILYISDIYLNIKMKYGGKTEAGKDTIFTGYAQMAATKEVFMSSRFDNANLKDLVNDEKQTYLKTPAGICTEVTLPLEKMFEIHKNDTLNAVSMSFQKLKEQSDRPFKMGTPSQLLLVRKNDMTEFFEQNKTEDNISSFLTSFNAKKGTYDFLKLNRLVGSIFSEIKTEKAKGEAAWEEWKKKNEGWDKVLLIPVVAEIDANMGKTISIENDLNVNSASLVKSSKQGDKDSRIKMKVICTRPQQYN